MNASIKYYLLFNARVKSVINKHHIEVFNLILSVQEESGESDEEPEEFVEVNNCRLLCSP